MSLTIEDFEYFWSLYPKRNGKKTGKKETRGFFDKHIREEEFKVLLKAVKNYSQSRIVKTGFAKDPVRFLKGDYWHEWLEPEVPTVQTGMAALKALREEEGRGEDDI